MGSSFVVRCLRGDDDVAVVGEGQSSFCNGWSCNVAAQALKLLKLIRLAGNSGFGQVELKCLGSVTELAPLQSE